MDAADSAFLHELFKENNDLRSKNTAVKRELFNKSLQCDQLEDELRTALVAIEDLKILKKSGTAPKDQRSLSTPPRNEISATGARVGTANAKELEEAQFAIEKQNSEIVQFKSDIARLKLENRQELQRSDNLAKELETCILKNEELTLFKKDISEKLESESAHAAAINVPEEIIHLKDALDKSNHERGVLRKRLLDLVEESNRIQNNQQNQLQGTQAIIEEIRDQYDEFIQVTRHEYDIFKNRNVQEYEQLKSQYDNTKLKLYEEKKKMTFEFQSLLFSMQSQFEDYRKTTEFLFSSELVKLEDEISSQAQRYEQEIMYIIQAKDKFYSDMMVAKDAKIMALIEGSDLQSIMQKHELDMELVRKEHAKEIERIKSDQETESKNIIALLQRQNVSLESKCDKLQAHLKILEGRMKELMSTIESKNKTIAEKDELAIKVDFEHQSQISDINTKMNQLSQEKEHLRHKVIRLNLDARGEGENSIQNMLKRITRETSELHRDFDEMGAKYEAVLTENQNLNKKLKDKEKITQFLESEIKKRSEEYLGMTRTFEDFLEGRAKQARKERAKRLAKLASQSPDGSNPQLSNANGKPSSNSHTHANNKNGSQTALNTFNKAQKILKVHIPDKQESTNEAPTALYGQAELDRGYTYLKRFKNLSKAFATGDFRMIPQGEQLGDKNMPGPWQNTALYSKLEETNVHFTKLYKETPHAMLPFSAKSSLYKSNEQDLKKRNEINVKVYDPNASQANKNKALLSIQPKKTLEGGKKLGLGGVSMPI